ncbi:MAG: hypothetical protein OXI72_09755 [Gemmatimonadota bacterium]|nr:hypothetical protein [Gemmatimonadota bacterium]
MRTYIVPFLFLLLLSSCDQIGQALGLTVISVENSTDIDGFEVFGNGEKQFTLDAGEKDSFTANGDEVSSVRVVVRHQNLDSDLVMTIRLTGEGGGSAKLLISEEILLNRKRLVLTCPGCAGSGKSNPVSW